MAVSLVWRQVQRIEQQKKLAELSCFEAVLVGGGPADSSLVQLAADLGLNLIATYGMTETCGGVVWNGQPLSDTNIAVDSAVGQVGVITVTGPTVGWGYLGSASWALSNRQHSGNRSFQTNDLGVIDSSGRLQIVGRTDDIAIINGHNVSLSAVEAAIAQLPGVEEVGAFVCDQGSGQRLFVAIAPAGPAAPDLAQVRAHLSVTLGRGAHPAEVINLPSLPRGQSGKIDREELKAGL
jgi:O-succinylbenzoic acid--CoA ligase